MASEETDFTPVHWDGSSMEWRKIIGSPYCSLPSGHKHILTTMARYGDKWGDSIFPSQRELAFRAGVSTKCVNQVMQNAEAVGWIVRYEIGVRQGYKRHTYELTVPVGVIDFTTFMKRKFWEPPYKYRSVRCNGAMLFEKRDET